MTGGLPDKIYFYCTGISNKELTHSIQAVIKGILPESEIIVASDVTGAAIAGLGKAEGTVLILGTGSHAASWNGQEICKASPSLGYIVGDEGSGADIGKSIIRGYYYNTMPEHIREQIQALMPPDRIAFLRALTNHPAPNEYLASFTRVFKDNIEHPWLLELVSERFKAFVAVHVKGVATSGPIVGVGSIGCIFADTINNILMDEGFASAKWIHDPSSGMEDYHSTNG